MDAEARLSRALATASAPPRDPRFTLAVMRRAEVARFRDQAARQALRTAGLAIAAVGLTWPAAHWAAANLEAVENGALVALGLLAAVAGARVVGRRLAYAAR